MSDIENRLHAAYTAFPHLCAPLCPTCGLNHAAMKWDKCPLEMTDAELEAELDSVEPIPVTREEIESIVQRITATRGKETT